MSAPTPSNGVRPYPELSLPALFFGTLQGVVMTASFVYLALKLGVGLGGSTVAAILGFVVLRGALGRKSIVENNINQTVASGINTASSGVVFTLPALFLLSVADPTLKDPPLLPLVVSAMAGSLMGIVLIIPLRKQMIEFERLKFPSGVAVATLLRSPGEGLAQGLVLLGGAGIGLLFTVAVNLAWVPEELDLGALTGTAPAWFPLALYISAANFGAGLLSGKGGLPFAFGGMLAWWLVAPIAVFSGWVPVPDVVSEGAVDGYLAGEIYGQMLRPLGIGMLIGGALAGVVTAFPAVSGALRSLQTAAKLAREQGSSPEELPLSVLGLAAAGSVVMLFVSAFFATPTMTLGTALMVGVFGSAWLALAGIIVAQATGATDISPLSGLALIAVTLMFFITGGDVTAAVFLGVAVSIATSQCADMMQDLKTGHLVGSRPREQQLAQLVLCWLGPLVAIGVLFLLWHTPDGSPGFGPDSTACLTGQPGCLSAPQAGALQGMIEALQSSDAAVDKYASGAVIGGALSIFPIGGIAVLVGLAMYLPFSITFAYGVGNVVAMVLEWTYGKTFIARKLVPFAAGLIVGEALTQLVWNLAKIALGGDA